MMSAYSSAEASRAASAHTRLSRSQPLVSVVVVTFESAADIVGCIQSLLSSDLPVEIIVLDNGSRDDTVSKARAILDRQPDCHLICNDENLGFAKAVNKGIERASGQFVLLFNPDCVVHPETIRTIIEVMQTNPDAAMAGCLLLNPDGTEQAGCRRSQPTPWRSLVRVLRLHRIVRHDPRFRGFLLNSQPLPQGVIEVEALSGAFMLVRRSAIDEVGRLDETYFMHCEDLDWCMQFRRARWRILFVPFVSCVHKKGQSSKTRPVRVEFYKHRGMIRFYQKFFRHQYPGLVMWFVVMAVWIRFVFRAVVVAAPRLRTSKEMERPPHDEEKSNMVTRTDRTV